MGYPAKIQLAGKTENPQWHINIPNAIAKGLDLRKGEPVEWEIDSRTTLVVVRKDATPRRKLSKLKLGEHQG